MNRLTKYCLSVAIITLFFWITANVIHKFYTPNSFWNALELISLVFLVIILPIIVIVLNGIYLDKDLIGNSPNSKIGLKEYFKSFFILLSYLSIISLYLIPEFFKSGLSENMVLFFVLIPIGFVTIAIIISNSFRISRHNLKIMKKLN